MKERKVEYKNKTTHMAKLYRVTEKHGEWQEEVSPADGKRFTLTELREFVGGTIDIQRKPREKRGGPQMVMVVNDNGKLEGLPYNEAASKIWREWYPIEKYPINNDQTIVGTVLVCSANQVR